MPMSDALLPEFDQETAGTRKSLARVPDDKFDWKPHEKSYSFQELSTHLSNLPRWTVMIANETDFDVAPVGEEPPRQEPVGSAEEAVRMFDENAAAAREAIAGLSDEQMMETWTLLAGGEEVFSMPRAAVIRSTIMNHMIHHRAQLGVYLRLNDVPVPSLYGPTADEE
jgi:uncharacterized damage-inducible protein DinB